MVVVVVGACSSSMEGVGEERVMWIWFQREADGRGAEDVIKMVDGWKTVMGWKSRGEDEEGRTVFAKHIRERNSSSSNTRQL